MASREERSDGKGKQMSHENWQVRRLAGSLGAEITVDLNKIAIGDEAGTDEVKALLLEHQVIFFPDQNVDIDSHVALGKRFAKVENHPNLKNPFTQHSEVFELAATHGGVADVPQVPTSPLKIGQSIIS